jgi:hypothetical protein
MPVSSPPDEKVTPAGRGPVSAHAGAGEPEAWTVKEPADPTMKVDVALEMIVGAVPTVRTKF